MKKISSTFVMFIMISGLLSSIAMPIYLMISTSSLKNILPEWFVITNFILSTLMMIFIFMLFILFVFNNDKSLALIYTNKIYIINL